jgi:hypothetical protein
LERRKKRMKNKVLVKVYVPSVDEEYEIYIPTNETINKVLELIVKSVSELSDDNLDLNQKHYLLDPETSIVYDNSNIVRDTNIKNSKKLILI